MQNLLQRMDKAQEVLKNDKTYQQLIIDLTLISKGFASFYKRKNSEIIELEQKESALCEQLKTRESQLGIKKTANGFLYY